MYSIPPRSKTMLLKYNTEKLKGIMTDFHNITGINMSLLDADQNLLIGFSHDENSFCGLIHRTPEGNSRCLQSDCELFEMCAKAHSTVTHKCHAGLTDMLVPIYKSNTLLGYIIFGQAGDEKQVKEAFDTVYENVRDLGVDKEKLRQAYEKLVLFDRSQLDSAAAIVTVLTKYMLFEHMIDTEYNDIARKISDYIEQNLSQELTVIELCKKFHVSKNKLYSIFNANFECGVKEYIDKRRLANAEELLKTTQMSVYEVSLCCGVDNYQNFCRFFKRQTGVSPLQYRKAFTGKQQSKFSLLSKKGT